MRSRSATLTCPTQLYCSTASAGSSTRNSTATSAGPEGHLIFTSRSLTCGNRCKTLILKVLHSLQRLCSPLTSYPVPTGIMLPMHSHRVVSVFLLAAVVAASVYAGQAQDAVAKGASILADARKAVGGEDKLAAIKALQARGTVRRAAGEVNLEGDLDLSIELPGKYLRKESIILGGNGQGLDRVEGLNGSEAWEEIKFGGGVNFGDGGDF